MHSAQGVTADTTHAVLGENTTRALFYVAMTRCRDANTAYLHERIAASTNTTSPTAFISRDAAPAATPRSWLGR